MRLKDKIKSIPYLVRISSLAKKNNIKAWLVGGALRDMVIKKKGGTTDFDFCIERNTFLFASKFAKSINSRMIILDSKQKSYRVIAKIKGKFYTYDFTGMRGKDLRSDLLSRDFTINTLVLSLNDMPSIKIIDLLGARRDLAEKRIRVVDEPVLKDDPLRILRAFSLSSLYGFRIEKKTERMLINYKKFIGKVSKERINEELFKILSSPRAYPVIKKMSDLFIIDEVIPYVTVQRGVHQGAYHHLDVWRHSLEALLRLEALTNRRLSRNKEIRDYLYKEVTGKHKLIDVIKLAVILHDSGKPFAKKIVNKKTIFHTHEKIGADLADEVCKKLKLSLKEKDMLKKLIFWHLRPGYLADQRYPSKRAVYRFFRDTGDYGPAVIILSLADWRATRGPLTDSKKRRRHERIMLNLINKYFKDKKNKPLPKLIDGFDIMKRFNLEPSPLVGKVLKKIKEEQVLGKITNKHEAYKFAQRIIERQVTRPQRHKVTKSQVKTNTKSYRESF